MSEFSPADYWKALILYGLNTATYKIALGKTLLNLAGRGKTHISWEELSNEFFGQYLQRLSIEDPMPQLENPGRLTVMERIVQKYKAGRIDRGAAVEEVGKEAFGDVIRRFHNLGRFKIPGLSKMFYEFDFGKELILTDPLFLIGESNIGELHDELEARWGLLEGAFVISNSDYRLGNELREIYIANGYDRRSLAELVPFLKGYQGDVCFFCGESILPDDVHVDHLLPRQVLEHDEIWNLVLAHSYCNQLKSDRIVGEHYVQKLVARNENIMGSNHPWKHKISQALGKTPLKRAQTTKVHYENVCVILGRDYWNGDSGFSPESDPFYRKLITVLNNKGLS